MLNNRQDVIPAFKTGIFPYGESQIKEESEEESEGESGEESEKESEKKKEKKDDFKKSIEYIEKESKSINYNLFKELFNFVVPSALAKKII